MILFYKLAEKPHQLFLIDGVGAALTSFSLLLVLPRWNAFQMPPNILYFLGTIAILFAAYSLSNYYAKLAQVKLLIRVIAIANLIYCLFSGFIVLQLFGRLSFLDVVYFAGEILLVSTLAVVELQVARRMSSSGTFSPSNSY